MDSEDEAIVDGYIDHVIKGVLQAWVWMPSEPDRALGVDVFVDKIHVGQFLADLPRDDLVEAGKGNGRHGLHIDLRPVLAAHPQRSFTVELSTSGPVVRKFATTQVATVDAAKTVVSISGDKRQKVRDFFSGRLLLEAMNLKAAEDMIDAAPPSAGTAAKYDILVQPRVAPPGRSAAGLQISKYADFVRTRFKADRQFQIDVSQSDSCDFIKWYLEFYCVLRGEMRAPLSGDEIAYLNEMIPLAGKKHYLSRATMFFLFDALPQFSNLDLNSLDSYIGITYWWSVERARSMFVEDCLVPEQYAAALSSVRDLWRTVDYPPSRFIEIFFSRNSTWHFLDLHSSDDRRLLYFVMLLYCLERPAYLRYIPRHWVRQLFVATRAEPSLFEQMGRRIFDFHSPLFEPSHFKAAIARAGYDFDGCRNRAITASGGRVRAAALPVPSASADMVDIQVIGPFEKASGLGQACRLSAQVLSLTKWRQSSYNYDRDNPAPVGFNGEQETNGLKRARINLLHLNAESIPLAFAFLPDVFTGAYNIGYFFWELSTPASCHALALELLDEIWVSSEYGVEIYRPHTDRPVTRVGMPYEEVPHVEKAVARAFAESRFGVQPGEFVFFAAFDSFSFVQRKNPLGLIEAFQRAFTGGEKVRLLMKTHNRDFVTDPQQQRIWRAIAEAADSDPRITVVNETLPYADLIALKAGMDCYVSLHKSEGLGFGMLEAMNLGVPVLATGYSGNTDFCTPETCWLVDYDMEELGAEDYIFVVPGQKWASPKVESAARQMRGVFSDRLARSRRSEAATKLVRSEFSPQAVASHYGKRVSEILQEPRYDSSGPIRFVHRDAKALGRKKVRNTI